MSMILIRFSFLKHTDKDLKKNFLFLILLFKNVTHKQL